MLNGPPDAIGRRLEGADLGVLATPQYELGTREEPPDLEALPHRLSVPDPSLTHRQLEIYHVLLAVIGSAGDQQTIRAQYEPAYWLVGLVTTASANPAVVLSYSEGGISFVLPTAAGVIQFPHAGLIGPKGTIRIPGRGPALTLLNRDAAAQQCLVYACRNEHVEFQPMR